MQHDECWPNGVKGIRTVTVALDPVLATELDLLTALDTEANAFKIVWRAPFMGDRHAVADHWFEIQDILGRMGTTGREYLIVESAKPTSPRRWAQCLGRPDAMSVEIAVWAPNAKQADLWRLGRAGAQHPLINVHTDSGIAEMVRPCQVLTAHDAVTAFHDWLVHRQSTGFTKEQPEPPWGRRQDASRPGSSTRRFRLPAGSRRRVSVDSPRSPGTLGRGCAQHPIVDLHT